jgi:hypothetical protein
MDAVFRPVLKCTRHHMMGERQVRFPVGQPVPVQSLLNYKDLQLYSFHEMSTIARASSVAT